VFGPTVVQVDPRYNKLLYIAPIKERAVALTKADRENQGEAREALRKL
jgi:hypothetical protein